MENSPQTPKNQPMRPEREHQGPIWKHPYFAYIYGSVALFSLLLLIGWLGLENGWIPSRGIENVGTREMQGP